MQDFFEDNLNKITSTKTPGIPSNVIEKVKYGDLLLDDEEQKNINWCRFIVLFGKALTSGFSQLCP